MTSQRENKNAKKEDESKSIGKVFHFRIVKEIKFSISVAAIVKILNIKGIMGNLLENGAIFALFTLNFDL